MLGWFASALMRGFDEGRQRLTAAAAVPSSPDEPICKCGSIMVCPDIGCDENKAVPSSPAQPSGDDLSVAFKQGWDTHAALPPSSPVADSPTKEPK